MAMKNKKKGNKNGRRLSPILRDNKGIENRVWVYVVAAVVLVVVLGMAMQIANSGQLFAGIGLAKGAKEMKEAVKDDTDIDTSALQDMIDAVKK